MGLQSEERRQSFSFRRYTEASATPRFESSEQTPRHSRSSAPYVFQCLKSQLSRTTSRYPCILSWRARRLHALSILCASVYTSWQRRSMRSSVQCKLVGRRRKVQWLSQRYSESNDVYVAKPPPSARDFQHTRCSRYKMPGIVIQHHPASSGHALGNSLVLAKQHHDLYRSIDIEQGTARLELDVQRAGSGVSNAMKLDHIVSLTINGPHIQHR